MWIRIFFHSLLIFFSICKKRFPTFYLAKEALISGIEKSIVFNAANTLAVKRFLNQKMSFNKISQFIEQVLEAQDIKTNQSINDRVENYQQLLKQIEGKF